MGEFLDRWFEANGVTCVRVSALFGISGTQGTLDFIDVDTDSDTPLFIDPTVLATMNSSWTAACASGVRTFFQEVLDRIVARDADGAMRLLRYLGEENATHLGYSSTSRGSGVGRGLATRFYQELSTSRAVRSGLIKDLEDTALLIEGVREDRISDVVTNIIRRQLVEYTQRTAQYYGIPLQPGVAIGPYWDVAEKRWKQSTFDLPVTSHGPLLLVPKAIVRRSLFLQPGEYYRHYVLEYFRQQELRDPQSPLVVLLRSGRRKGEAHVFKGDVEAKVRERNEPHRPGVEKRVNVDATERIPELLTRYKSRKLDAPPAPLSPTAVSEATDTSAPDLDSLLAKVLSCKPGKADSTNYERAVEELLSALFYPSLVNPIRQEAIHDGRKRIDISFTNAGVEGDFFYWLSMHFPAANIVAECKNYNRPVANPEYDQLAGRFSPSRGKVGLLVYRGFEDKDQIMESCKDTADDSRGFIIPLDDNDLKDLVAEAKNLGCTRLDGLLHRRFNTLIGKG